MTDPKRIDDPSKLLGFMPDKFNVFRTDGSSAPGGKHEHCHHFVLDLMHDKFARPALEAYATACEAEYPFLAQAIRDDLLKRAL